MITKTGLVLTIFLLVTQAAESVLTGYERNVLENQAFGCEWLGGGIATTLLCSCRWQGEEFYIQEGTIRTTDVNTIRIANCDSVKFGSNSVQTIRNLRRIELSNITNLTLEESSLSWEGYVANGDLNTPSLRVTIENSGVRHVSSYTFKGRINDVTFRNVIVENLASFAFSSLKQNQNIFFEGSDFRNVHPQALKKFSTEYLTISNCSFATLPSRAFSELSVTERFLIQNSTFEGSKPAAFLVQNPKRFEVTNSQFSSFDGESFKVTTRGDAVFRNDVFDVIQGGAFAGMSVDLEQVPTKMLMILDGLSVNDFSWEILKINGTSFDLKLTNFRVMQDCDCRFFSRASDDYDNQEISCLFDGRDLVTLTDFRASGCSILTGRATIIIVVGVSLILLIIVLAALVIYFRKAYASDKYGDEKKDKAGQLSLIVPDGRTYRETELHVYVERADVLTTDL